MTEPKPDIEPVATLVERLRLWLVKRGEPDSGLHYEGVSYNLETGAIRDSYVTLTGSDADFIAANFHGKGARELASALLALEGERDALREALKPFATCIDRLAPGEDISHWALGDALNHGLTVEHVLRAQAALSSSEHI
jgi:hypothetical protein